MQFLLVYIKEAHAMDSRAPSFSGPLVEDPVTDSERFGVAKTCVTDLGLDMIPAVVDRIDDRVNRAYGGWPDRLYLVGRDGKIAFAGARGPMGFRPGELEKAIKAELEKIRARGKEGIEEGASSPRRKRRL